MPDNNPPLHETKVARFLKEVNDSIGADGVTFKQATKRWHAHALDFEFQFDSDMMHDAEITIKRDTPLYALIDQAAMRTFGSNITLNNYGTLLWVIP